MELTAYEIASYTQAQVLTEPLYAQKPLTSITWDSREVVPNCVYVAFKGARVNGIDFAAEALRKGACALLVQEQLPEEVMALAREMGAAVLQVADTQAAFTLLAARWRKDLHARVIALTGSVGKTTTKNMVRSVLATTYKTVATKANQNNELGVPNTLLSAHKDTQCVVVEMGMRGLGQIEELCAIARPDVALITNVGECHLELLGTRENIARAKAEIIESLRPGGVALLNANDDFTPFILEYVGPEECSVDVMLFGTSPASLDEEAQTKTSGNHQKPNGASSLKPYVRVTNIEVDGEGRPHFMLHIGEKSAPVTLQMRGAHNARNAAAAAAVGQVLGVKLEQIATGLEQALPEAGRQEILTARCGATVINDAYNASPDSMRASLAFFTQMDVKRKRYAVLGNMEELGPASAECHKGIGTFAAQLPLDALVCIGEKARAIGEAALAAGFPESAVFMTDMRGEALNYLETHIGEGDAVLLKASHSMELDRIAKGLTD